MIIYIISFNKGYGVIVEEERLYVNCIVWGRVEYNSVFRK